MPNFLCAGHRSQGHHQKFMLESGDFVAQEKMDEPRVSSSEDPSSPTAKAFPWTLGSQGDGSLAPDVTMSSRPKHVRMSSTEITYPVDTDVEDVNRTRDAEDSDKWLQFLEEQYVEATQNEGALLQSAMEEAASRLTSESNSICGPRPLFAILPTLSFKTAVLMFAMLHLSLGIGNFLTSGYAQSYTSTTFHFRIMELRTSSAAASTTNVADLGININSCDLHGATVNASGSVVSVRFDRPVEMNGFFIAVGGADPALDPTKLRITYLDMTAEEPNVMRVIAQPRWWTDWGEGYDSSEEWELRSRREPDALATIRMRTNAPTVWTIGLVLESTIVFLACAICLVTLLLGMYTMASRVLASALAVFVFKSLAFSILFLATEDWQLSFRWFRGLSVSSLLTPCVAFPSYEKALVPVFFVAACCNMLMLLADHALVRGIPSMLLKTQEVYVGAAMLSIGASLAVLWSRKLKSVQLLVKQDKAAFDEAWKQILSTTAIDTIEELCRTVKLFSPSSTRGRPIQQVRASRNAWQDAGASSGDVPVEKDRSFTLKQRCRSLINTDGTRQRVEPGPVGSLDQLYAQAASCSVLLRRKAQHAALNSGGGFPITPRPAFRGTEGEAQHFMTLCDIQLAGMALGPDAPGREEAEREVDQEQDCPAEHVQWTDLKPAKRAVDKVLKQYHGEVHRLLDVCRESIIFEDFLGIASCVRALASDPQVVIERIKNSLDPNLDASPTAGFRAVSVNLRIVSPLSRWLCVDGHVCELLLTLRPLAQCMTHQSHQQYLQLRNFRVASRIPGFLSTLLPCGRWVGHAPQEPPRLALAISSPKNAGRIALNLMSPKSSSAPTPRGDQSCPLPLGRPVDAPAQRPARPSGYAFAPSWSSWEQSTSRAGGFGEFVANRLPSVVGLVPTRWRRNRVHSEDDLELGTVQRMFAGAATARCESPFHTAVDGDRKFLSDDETPKASRSVGHAGMAPDAAAGVFNDAAGPAALQHSSLSGVSASPPRLNRASTSNLSNDSRPPRLRRTSVSLIREESGQTESFSIEREGGKWLSVDDLGDKSSRMELLRWQYVRRTLLPGGLLDKLRCRIEAAVADVELFSVFETSYPIAAALCKRPIRYALLCAALLYAAMVYIDTAALTSLGQIRGASRLRFRPTRLRGGGDADAAPPAVHRIGVMQDGCMLDSEAVASMACVSGECIVDLGGAWNFNGFYFVTKDGPRALDPVAFTLDAQGLDEHAGNEWVRVGSWRRMLTLSGGQEWLMRRNGRLDGRGLMVSERLSSRVRTGAQPQPQPHAGDWELKQEPVADRAGKSERPAKAENQTANVIAPPPTDQGGGAVVQVEMRAPWHAWLGSWTLDFAAMMTAIALWCVSKAERPGWGRPVVVSALFCVGCCLAVNAGAETVARGSAGAFPLQWTNAGAMIAIGVGLIVREQLALMLWLYAGVHFIVMREIEDWMVYSVWGDGGEPTSLESYPIASYVFVVVGFIFVAMRRRLHVLSGRGIAQDMSKYREAWSKLCEDEEERASLERVRGLCSSVWAVTVANGGAQQRCRLKDADGVCAASLRRSPSVGAAKLLDLFAGWSVSRKNSQQSRRRASSMALAAKSLETRRSSSFMEGRRASSVGPRSPGVALGTSSVSIGLLRTPHSKRDSETGLRTPEGALRQPEPIATTPEAQSSASSGTRVVMLGQVRRQSTEPTVATSREEKGGMWAEWQKKMGLRSSGRIGGSERAMSSGSGRSSSRTGARWGFSSSSGSRSTWRSGSLRRANSEGDGPSWLQSFRLGWKGWQSARRSIASRSSGRLSRTGSWSMGGGGGGGDGRAGTRRVLSLDQLYVQAAGVYPLLKEKVKEWAWGSRGCLRMKKNGGGHGRKASTLNGGHFERWDLLAGDANLERMVRWATLKKRQRASEKLVRSYQGKVWKLLDICRQSVVFDFVADLADCLQLILQDQTVMVCSVKNRLALDYDDKETAGYRDVNINLCFQSEVAKQLGVDNHVCEVQLLLRSFAELKTDEGHGRYVRFRNARAQ